MKRIVIFLMIGFSLISVPCCSKKTDLGCPKIVTENQVTIERPRITIWVHGTHFWFNKLIPHVKKQKKGLSLANTLPENLIYNKLIARKLSSIDPEAFPYEHFYLFAWSGMLSFEAREQAAQLLYKELKELIATYKEQYGIAPEITIITHSHGGNVALNLAKVKDAESQLQIDRLILLAVPVQVRTLNCVHDSVFKQIYSFYSRFDSIQVLDAQGMYQKTAQEKEANTKIPLFSQRIFPECNHLVQVKMRFDGIGPFHISYILWNFMNALPSMMKELACYEDGNHHHVKIFLKNNKIPHITHLH